MDLGIWGLLGAFILLIFIAQLFESALQIICFLVVLVAVLYIFWPSMLAGLIPAL